MEKQLPENSWVRKKKKEKFMRLSQQITSLDIWTNQRTNVIAQHHNVKILKCLSQNDLV